MACKKTSLVEAPVALNKSSDFMQSFDLGGIDTIEPAVTEHNCEPDNTFNTGSLAISNAQKLHIDWLYHYEGRGTL